MGKVIDINQYKNEGYAHSARAGNDPAPISAIRGIGSSHSMMLAALAFAAYSMEQSTPKEGYSRELAESHRNHSPRETYNPVEAKFPGLNLLGPSNGPKAYVIHSSYQQSTRQKLGANEVYERMKEQRSITDAIRAAAAPGKNDSRKSSNLVYMGDRFRHEKKRPASGSKPGTVFYFNEKGELTEAKNSNSRNSIAQSIDDLAA
jgi:hypothetical protein